MPMPCLKSMIAIVIATLLVLTGCGREVPPAVVPAQPVRVTAVVPIHLDHRLVATGLVRAAVEAPLAFKTPGIIAELKVSAGQSVSAGQALASLVTTDLDAQLMQSQENLAKTERDLARMESLRAKGMISQQAEQDVRAQRAVARSALAAATFNRQQAVITAPAAGVILDKRADARETVAAGQPVVILGRLDRGWVVRAGLPAKEAMQVSVGDGVRIAVEAADAEGATFEARITRIAATSDPRTGTVEVEATLPSSRHRLVSGMVARLEFGKRVTAGEAIKPVVILPPGAVLEGNDGHARVFVLDAEGTKVKRVDVRTGRLHHSGIEIVEGLADGAKVVTEGAAWLNDGETVRVLP